MSTLQSYHADTAVLVLKDDAAGTTFIDTAANVIVLKEVDFQGDFELIPLYGMDSIVRQDIVQTKLSVTVRARFAKFDGQILGHIAQTENDGKDIDGAVAAGRTQIVVKDTNTPNLFDIWATVSNGSDSAKAKVTNVAFKNLPFKLPEGEWVELDLEGEGDLIYFEVAT
jgi:hypothetical protein